MTAPLVVVIGAGVAGTSAAVSAAAAGARVKVISLGPGASSLMSGAVDALPWELDDPGTAAQPLTAEARSFLDAMKLWSVDDSRKVVATLAGGLRTARGADRAVLNLARLAGRRVAVPRLQRGAWDADLLVGCWNAAPWAAAHALTFEAVDAGSLFDDAEPTASDADLAALTDAAGRVAHLAERLRAATAGFDAVLTGPWLGIATDGAGELSRALGKPAGETLSMLSGAAGARFEAASERVLGKLERVQARVTEVVRAGEQWRVRHNNEETEASAVIIACGGLVGGGIRFTPSEMNASGELPAGCAEPFALSFTSPTCLAIGGRPIGRPASLQGPNLEDYGWPTMAGQRALFERVGVHHRDGRTLDRAGRALERMLVAGSAASGAWHSVLDSIEAGATAGRVAGCG